MPDFSQNELITTLHDLGESRRAQLEAILEEATQQYPLGLILPVTSSDLRAKAFSRIVSQLVKVRYIDTIVVALDQTPAESDYRFARELIRPLGNKAEVLWIDGPHVSRLYEQLNSSGNCLSVSGKGRSVWTAFGWLLADPRLKAFALHDCDIVDYDRLMLARLCLPMAHPGLNFDFSKAYYVRCTDRLYGRVVRLLMTPLLRTLSSVFDGDEFLAFLASFRYPLAGEIAISTRLALCTEIPSDWGLEVGMLAEVYRYADLERICQVDLSVPYEHKHQDLSLDDPSKGLMRMSIDILVAIFRALAGRGLELAPSLFAELRTLYLRAARNAIRQYHADTLMNGIVYDRESEEATIEGFAAQITAASEMFRRGPSGKVIPNWGQLLEVDPHIPQQLRDATISDAKLCDLKPKSLSVIMQQ